VLQRLPRPLALSLKLGFTALAVWLVAGKVDVAALLPVLRTADWRWIVACLALQVPLICLNAARWRVLFPVAGVTLRKYAYYVLVGHFLALLLPSTALAEGARTYAFGRKYGGLQKNFVAAVLARAVGLFTQIALAIVFLVFAWSEVRALPVWGEVAVLPMSILVAAVGLGIVAVLGWRFRERLLSIWDDLRSYLRDTGLMSRVFMLSLLIQVLSVVSVYTLFRAVNWPVAMWILFLIPFLVQVGLLLPVTLGGVGVREYLNILLYGTFAGIPPETILGATVLGYLPLLVAAASGGLWMALRALASPEAHR
jgi:uncharacterized membrane protein YbhN (UPF0104 family)